MARYNIGWYAHGSAMVEADDYAEAMDVLHEGLLSFDATVFEEFEVRGTGTENQ